MITRHDTPPFQLASPKFGHSSFRDTTDLFADRTRAATMCANQIGLWFASMAYVLVTALRRIGLAVTDLAAATCGSIRLKLLKIGAMVIRRSASPWLRASSCPDAATFRLAHARLCG